MKIKYRIEISDLEEFSKYHFSQSPKMKRMNLWVVAIFSVAIFAVIGAVNDFSYTTERVIGALAISTVFGAYFILTTKRRVAYHARRVYSEGKGDGLIGDHELELDEDYLIERTDSGETRTKISKIHKAGETDTHAFIYIASVMAHVIPKSKITDGNLAEFMEILRSRLNVEQAAAGNVR